MKIFLVSLTLTMLFAACKGSVETTAGAHGDEPGASAPVQPGDPVISPLPTAEQCKGIERTPGTLPTRLLTTPEYNHAVAELFPAIELQPVVMPLDSRVGSFVLNAREDVAAAHIRDFRMAAETIAARLVQDLESILPSCEEGMSVDEMTACFAPYLDELMLRAFRRPATEQESDGYLQLFTQGWQEGGIEEAFLWTFEALLQAPSFIYIHEEAGVAGINDYEIAQRMASMLWRSIPDDALLQLASEGRLQDPETRAAEARRMLRDERAQRTIRSMVMQWIGVQRLPGEPFAQDADGAILAAAMLSETQAFVDDVIGSSGSYIELLEANYSIINQRMAEHYGLDISDLGAPVNGQWRVEIPHRVGLLTQASYLTLEHGVVHRGLFVRGSIMCQLVPGPEGIDTEAIPTAPGESERSKSEKRMDERSCAGCHAMMDPLGLPFDVFDEIGRHRSEDSYGNPVFSHGEILGSHDSDQLVANAVEMVQTLAWSTSVRDCVSAQLYTWTFASVPTGERACIVSDIASILDQNNGDLREALVGLIQSDAFVRRTGDRP